MSAPPVISSTRAAILESATTLFGAQGYAGTTMRDIATVVGVLPGSLYTHIEGKEQLLLEVVEAGVDLFLNLEYLKDDHSSDAAERFRSFIKGHVNLVAQNPGRSRVINHQWRFLTGERLQRVVEKRRRYEEILRVIVEDGKASGVFDPAQDLKVSLLVVLGALNWTPEWFKPQGPETAEEVGTRLADVLLGGLLKVPAVKGARSAKTVRPDRRT